MKKADESKLNLGDIVYVVGRTGIVECVVYLIEITICLVKERNDRRVYVCGNGKLNSLSAWLSNFEWAKTKKEAEKIIELKDKKDRLYIIKRKKELLKEVSKELNEMGVKNKTVFK